MVSQAPPTPGVHPALPTGLRADWLPLLTLTQATDLVCTLLALRFYTGVVEGNVVVAAVLGTTGPSLGLVALSLLSLGLLVAVTEFGGVYLRYRGHGVRGSYALRALGYGPIVALNLVVAVHNLRLLLGV